MLNIKEHVEAKDIPLDKKNTNEIKFKERHPELYVNEKDENEEAQEENVHKEEEAKDKDFWQVVEDYTVQEEKIWDCYQLFCKLINYKYNPYDDQELEDYLLLQEQDGIEELRQDNGNGGSMWPFKN